MKIKGVNLDIIGKDNANTYEKKQQVENLLKIPFLRKIYKKCRKKRVLLVDHMIESGKSILQLKKVIESFEAKKVQIQVFQRFYGDKPPKTDKGLSKQIDIFLDIKKRYHLHRWVEAVDALGFVSGSEEWTKGNLDTGEVKHISKLKEYQKYKKQFAYFKDNLRMLEEYVKKSVHEHI